MCIRDYDLYVMNKKYLNILRELTVSEFKLRDQSSLLGFFWTLLHPLLLFTVLYFLFTKWMGAFIEHYPLYLIIGIVQWTFFASSTTYALSSLVRRADLVKNLKFPYEIIVISSIFTALISHVFELIVLLVFIAAMGIMPGWLYLLLPLIVLIELMLIIAVSLPLAKLCVYYRDIEHIWSIFTTAGFFLTPIFYSLSIISPERRQLLLLNPVTHIINATRDCLIYHRMPDTWALFAIFCGSAVLAGAGYLLFKHGEKEYPEIL